MEPDKIAPQLSSIRSERQFSISTNLFSSTASDKPSFRGLRRYSHTHKSQCLSGMGTTSFNAKSRKMDATLPFTLQMYEFQFPAIGAIVMDCWRDIAIPLTIQSSGITSDMG